MKVLLIGPYSGSNSEKDTESKMYMEKTFLSPPLGIHRIASYLRPKHEVRVLDPNLEGPHKFLEEEAKNYPVIGFSLTHPTLEHDLSLIWQARRSNADTLLIAGGEEASFNHKQVFTFSPVDMVVLGEGEIPLSNICEKMTKAGRKTPEEFPSIPGLLIREGEDIRATGHNHPLSEEEFQHLTMAIDFENIPYEEYWSFMERRYEQLNDNAYQEIRTVRLFTSNYCPFRCKFCSSTNFHNFSCGIRPKFAFVPADGLLQLVEKALQAHPLIRTIFFHDDNFTLGRPGRERVTMFSKGIIQYKQQGIIPQYLSFMCQSRVDDVTKAMLELMAEAGFRVVSYGVESFSQNMLDEFGKKTTLHKIENALNWTYGAKIRPFMNMILTSPGCQASDIWLTAVGCVRHLKMGAGVGLNPYLMPFPGADILEDEETQNLIISKEVNIPDTTVTFNKAEKILPKDEEVRQLLHDMESQIAQLRVEGWASSVKRTTLELHALFLAFERLDQYKQEATKYLELLNESYAV